LKYRINKEDCRLIDFIALLQQKRLISLNKSLIGQVRNQYNGQYNKQPGEYDMGRENFRNNFIDEMLNEAKKLVLQGNFIGKTISAYIQDMDFPKNWATLNMIEKYLKIYLMLSPDELQKIFKKLSLSKADNKKFQGLLNQLISKLLNERYGLPLLGVDSPFKWDNGEPEKLFSYYVSNTPKELLELFLDLSKESPQSFPWFTTNTITPDIFSFARKFLWDKELNVRIATCFGFAEYCMASIDEETIPVLVAGELSNALQDNTTPISSIVFDAKYDDTMTPYEQELLLRNITFLKKLPNEMISTIFVEIPYKSYYFYIIDRYQKGLVSKEVALEYCLNIQQRGERMLIKYKTVLKEHFPTTKVELSDSLWYQNGDNGSLIDYALASLSASESLSIQIVNEKLEVLCQTVWLSLSDIIRVLPKDASNNILAYVGIISYLINDIKTGQEKASIIIDNPNEQQLLEKVAKVLSLSGKEVSFVGIYPMYPYFAPQDGRYIPFKKVPDTNWYYLNSVYQHSLEMNISTLYPEFSVDPSF